MFHVVDGERQSTLIPWGATEAQIDEVLTPAPGAKERPLHCRKHRDCRVRESTVLEGDWSVDFGSAEVTDKPILRLHEGKFYSWWLPITADNYESVDRLLTQSFGRPSIEHAQPSQNLYGAKWTGQLHVWSVSNVIVSLSVGLSSVDRGFLAATYKPLAPPDEEEKAQLPF